MLLCTLNAKNICAPSNAPPSGRIFEVQPGCQKYMDGLMIPVVGEGKKTGGWNLLQLSPAVQKLFAEGKKFSSCLNPQAIIQDCIWKWSNLTEKSFLNIESIVSRCCFFLFICTSMYLTSLPPNPNNFNSESTIFYTLPIELLLVFTVIILITSVFFIL